MRGQGWVPMRVHYSIAAFIMIVFSCFVSFCLVSHLISNQARELCTSLLLDQAESFVRLADRSGLSLEELVELSAPSGYQATLLAGPPADLAAPLEDSVPQAYSFQVLLKYRGQYVQFSLGAVEGIFYFFLRAARMAVLFCGAIGAVLMYVGICRTTRPLEQISRSLPLVAKGNFDVRLEYHKRNELGRLVAAFNSMVAELKKLELMRSDFVSSVSHEFKTPLASIQGFAKLIKSGLVSREEFDEYTDVIIAETGRLSNLSSNLMRLSKLETESEPLRLTTFSLDEQLRRSILLLQNQWTDKALELNVELDQVDYTGDEELLLQVWLNLLGNAVKFSSQGGDLTVRLRETEHWVTAEIADTGPGMTPDIQARMFEKFYKGDPSRSQSGNGLGLSIVKKIIDLCQGTITVKTEPGNGTMFSIKLPKNNLCKESIGNGT